MWSIITLSGHLPLCTAGRVDCVDGAATQRVNGKRRLRAAHYDIILSGDAERWNMTSCAPGPSVFFPNFHVNVTWRHEGTINADATARLDLQSPLGNVSVLINGPIFDVT